MVSSEQLGLIPDPSPEPFDPAAFAAAVRKAAEDHPLREYKEKHSESAENEGHAGLQVDEGEPIAKQLARKRDREHIRRKNWLMHDDELTPEQLEEINNGLAYVRSEWPNAKAEQQATSQAEPATVEQAVTPEELEAARQRQLDAAIGAPVVRAALKSRKVRPTRQ